MRIVFLGSGAFGLPTLRALATAHELLAVVTQPDRPAGRGGALTPTPIAAWAAEHQPLVPVLKPEKVNTPEVVAPIRGQGLAPKPDAMVVIAFGQKLGRALLDGIPAINLHASLLPRWRGAAPINAAVLAGDAVTGNSVITLADRMDAGLVLGQSRREIQPDQTAGELHDALAEDGPGLVLRVLGEIESGISQGTPQDESLVTLAPKLSKDDGWVDFVMSAPECRRRIHALTPWPGVTATLRSPGQPDIPLKLLRVQDMPGRTEQPPGAFIDAGTGIVACGNATALRLVSVQAPGKRAMAWDEFARGRRVPPDSVLAGGRR